MARRKDGRPRSMPVDFTVKLRAPEPIDVQCPACYSAPGKPCTQATDRGRREVKWVHLSREDEAIEFEED